MELNTALTLGSLFDGSGGFPLGGLLCGITPVWASEIEPVPHPGDHQAASLYEALRRHLPDGWREDRAGGHHHIRLPLHRHEHRRSEGRPGREAIRPLLPGHPHHSGNEGCHPWQISKIHRMGERPRRVQFQPRRRLQSRPSKRSIGIKEPGVQVPMPEKNLWPTPTYTWERNGALRTALLTRNTGESPSEDAASTLVADFAGWGAGQVLFESEGLSGYSAEGFRAWQRAAGDSAVGAGAAGVCLNDQGGSCMDVSSEVAATLRAEHHGHPPCVLDAAGFCTEHSADSRGIGFEPERAPTLRAGVVPAAIALESHPIDSPHQNRR